MKIQERVLRQQAKLRDIEKAGGSNANAGVDKYQLLRALTEAREAYALSDRTIAVLEALLSFHQSKELDGSEPIVVFPSNAELSLRTRGMAPATLRRHLACLVKAGFIIRRDSPNGKRYCKRNQNGQIESAFGFDLSPFVLEANEIYETAEKARAYALAVSRVRGEITIHLRDISKTVDAGLSEEMPGSWEGFADRLRALSGRVSRTAELGEHKTRCEALLRLRAEVELAYLGALSESDLAIREYNEAQEMSANESISERHIQNSKTDYNIDKSKERKQEENSHAISNSEANRKFEKPNRQHKEGEKPDVPPLTHVLQTCPEVVNYAKEGQAGLRSWRDLRVAADLVAQMLGISPDAWKHARDIMGEAVATVTVVAMLERADEIKSAGGYLRTLTDRAEQGKFTVWPMIRALENRE